MNRVYVFLVLSAIFFSCSKDGDDTGSGLQDFTVVLKVDPNHSFGEFTESLNVFLSDKDGTILDSGELYTGESLTLSFAGEPSAVYDLSYMRYTNFIVTGEKFYSLSTFSDIEQGTYDIGPSPLIENSQNEIYLKMDNTGYPFEVISMPSWAGDGGPENGGYFNFRSNLVGSPTSDFYVAFKSPNDQWDRYYWGENITEGSVFNIDYNTLPEIPNRINTQIPSNDYSFFSVVGLKNNDVNNIHHSIAFGNFAGGNVSLSTSAPSNVFDDYLFNVNYSNGRIGYSKQLRTTTIPEQINTPALDFTVNNPSPQNFNMTITGDASIYNVTYSGKNIGETVFVSQSIYGKVSSDVSFSKENLRNNIQQTYPELAGFETLQLGAISLTYYSLTNSYEDIVKYRIQGKAYEIPAVNGFIDGISKQYD